MEACDGLQSNSNILQPTSDGFPPREKSESVQSDIHEAAATTTARAAQHLGTPEHVSKHDTAQGCTPLLEVLKTNEV